MRCIDFVRQTLVLQKRSSGKFLPENCPTAPYDPEIEFYIYKVCPTNLRRSPACCSDFVRQSLSDKSHTAESNLQQFCPTKLVRQKSHCRVKPAAILSDKACPTKVTLQSQTCSNFVRQSLSDKSHAAASTFSNFVLQHQKRAGSFSSSPFPVDHYSVFTHCAETSAI